MELFVYKCLFFEKLQKTLLFCPDGEEKQYEQRFIDLDFVRALPFSDDVIPKGGSKAKLLSNPNNRQLHIISYTPQKEGLMCKVFKTFH
jgi:hydroxymethylpyrimidine pyrophosphatase-like HAD family hydrolase